MSARPSAVTLPLLLGWLRRARGHPGTAVLMLRGSLVTRALCGPGRPVADVDYLVQGDFDPDALARLAAEVAGRPDESTHLTLLRTEVIWAETAFPGVRAHLEGAELGGEPQEFQVDFAYGDPTLQAGVDLPIEGVGVVRACAPETLWAWKLHGLVEFGPGRWRAKDLYDLSLLLAHVPLDLDVLPQAVRLAFSSRNMALDELDDFCERELWGCAFSNGRKWRAFCKRYGIDAEFLGVRDGVRALVRQIGLHGQATEHVRRGGRPA